MPYVGEVVRRAAFHARPVPRPHAAAPPRGADYDWRFNAMRERV